MLGIDPTEFLFLIPEIFLGVCGFEALRTEHGEAGYAEIRKCAMEQVRLHVRAQDHALWVGEDRLGLLLNTGPALVSAICRRVETARSPGGSSRRDCTTVR